MYFRLLQLVQYLGLARLFLLSGLSQTALRYFFFLIDMSAVYVKKNSGRQFLWAEIPTCVTEELCAR